MMGRGHATMGAALWLTGCGVAHLAGARPTLAAVTVGTAMCAGWALAPDLDHPSSTLAHALGPVTRYVAKTIGAFGAWIHARTKTPADRADLDGHRTVTHTVVWALLSGILVTVAQMVGGRSAVGLLVLFAARIGVQTLLPSGMRTVRFTTGFGWPIPRRIRIATGTPIALVLAVAAAGTMSPSWWWLGLAAGAGSLIHCLGDALTDSGCPMLWPIVIRDRRWYLVGTPSSWRFAAGGNMERRFVQPLLWTIALCSLVWVAWGQL